MRMRAKYVSMQVATGKGVADRWRRQYFKDGAWKDEEKERLYEALCNLGGEPSADDANAIIGHLGWTYIWCDGCGRDVPKVINIGEHEKNSFCPTCIDEAYHLLHEDDSR